MSGGGDGFTGVPSASMFGAGRWPDQITFNKALSTFLYSVNSSPYIQALDHIHVINYDLDGADPYTMTINLPIMENLPLGARIYFFYVSRCHDGDQLTFHAVPLSGNSINGILGDYTFTLSGVKTLYMCVGINGNYIIHPFGGIGAPPPPVSSRSGIQSSMLYFVSPTPQVSFWTDSPAGLRSMFYPNSNAMDVFQPFGDVDISSYFNRNVAVPTKSIYGFQAVQEGWYNINLSFGAAITFDSTAGNNTWGDLGVFTSAGVQKSHWRSADTCANYYNSATTYPNIMCSQYTHLDAGDIVVWSFTIQGASIVTSVYTSAVVTFVYYGPTITAAPAPLAFSARAGVSTLSSTQPSEIVMGSAQDTPAKRKEVHKSMVEASKAQTLRNQRAQAMTLAAAGGSASSAMDISSQALTLADVESIVRQVMRASAVAQEQVQQDVPPPLSASSSRKRQRTSSSASSSASSDKGEMEL